MKLIALVQIRTKISFYQRVLIYKSLGYFEDDDREVTPEIA